jgi:anti-anti-sigma factor
VEEAVFYKDADAVMYIKADGHVTAALCPEVKAKAFARLEEAPAIASIYVELSDCEYMDSTFLGLIVGLNKRFKAKSGHPLVLLHANPTCLGLLKTIGVLKLVEVSNEERSFPMPMERISLGPRASASFLLDAHEELSDISEENKARFSSLTKALRDSIDKERD